MAMKANFDGIWKEIKIKASDTLPIGTQVAYGGAVPPTGWLICDGSAISRTQYAELFKVIGTSYGEGDGSTTFNLPNKKGRVSAGYDSTNSKFNAIGKKLGEETHTLTIDEMPQHTHIINTSINIGGQVENMPWGGAIATQVASTNAAGGNQPHNNIQPTEVDNWIIKAFQSIGVVGKVVNTKTTSDTDTYSCNYINSIVESGQNENGWWFKYVDGTMICTKMLAGTPDSVTPWTSGIYYKDIPVGNWAKSFTALINVQVSSSSTQYWCNIGGVNETSGGTVRLLRPDKNPVYYETRILAIGRWK